MRTIRYDVAEGQKLTPVCLSAIKQAKQEVFGEEQVRFVLDAGQPDIRFGVKGDAGVPTLSPKQVETAPDCISMLKAALGAVKNGGVTKIGIDALHTRKNKDLPSEYLVTFDIPIVIDIETNKLGEVICLALQYADDHEIHVYSKPDLIEEAVKALSRHNHVIGHNLKFDAGVLWRNYGYRIEVSDDTMLMHHCLNIGGTGHHGLKFLAATYFGAADWDSDLVQYTGRGQSTDYGKIPTDILEDYNALDVYWTMRLWELLKAKVISNDNTYRAYQHELRAANMLMGVEHRGVGIDVQYVEKLKEKLESRAAEALSYLPDNLNPASPKQVLTWLQEYGNKVGGTGVAELEALLKSPDTGLDTRLFCLTLLDYRKHVKLISTYCVPYLENNAHGVLYPTFNVHGTTTGRLSSSNPNAQNVPASREIRAIFVPKHPGYKFIEVDYSQAELRVMACLSGDERMISLFQPGAGDYFDNMMPEAFPSLFTSVQDYTDLKHREPEQAKHLRRQLKAVVYGLSFMRGARAIAESLEMPVSDAQAIIDNFLNSQPKLKTWRERVQDAALHPEKRDFLTSRFGRQYQCEMVTMRNKFSAQSSALSFLPQGTASDICIDAAVHIDEWVGDYDGEIVMLVHDAIYVECPEAVAEEVKSKMQYEMEASGARVFGDSVPFTTDGAVVDNWGECIG